MKRGLIITSSIGVGWILGIVLSMITMPLVGSVTSMSFGEAMGNTLIFGFPGLILLMVALILAQRDDVEDNTYKGNF